MRNRYLNGRRDEAFDIVPPESNQPKNSGNLPVAPVRRIGLPIVGACIGTLFYVIWLFSDPGANIMRDIVVYDSLIIIAIVALVLQSKNQKRKEDSDWLAWSLLAVGLSIWVASDMVDTLSYVGSGVETAEYTQWAFLAFYPFALASFVVLVRARSVKFSVSTLFDVIVVTLGLSAYLSVAAPIVARFSSTSNGGSLFASTASTAIAIVLLGILASVVNVFAWKLDRVLSLFVIGCSLMCVTDCYYLFFVGKDNYMAGAALDMGWLIAVLLMASSAFLTRQMFPKNISTARSATVPLLMSAASFVLIVVGTFIVLPWYSVALATSAVVFGGIRAARIVQRMIRAEERARIATVSSVTDLPNRSALTMLLNARFLAEEKSVESLIVLDAEKFREINGVFGFAKGDAVLNIAARRIRNEVRAGDVVIHASGDTFAVLLSTGTSRAVTQMLANRLVEAFNMPLEVDGDTFLVRMKAGFAISPDHGVSAEDLLGAADAAVHASRMSARSVSVYDYRQITSMTDSHTLVEKLGNAIDQGELTCYFQPKMRLSDGTAYDVEALIRWEHPGSGTIGPDIFLPLAEESGFMHKITARVLDVSLKQTAEWRAAGYPVRVAVNLSMTNLLDPAVPSLVASTLKSYGLPGDVLTLEVTETMIMHDEATVEETITFLQDMGVMFSVDDYGTGYSTLSRMRALSAKEIKLDRTLVFGLCENKELNTIVRTTIDLARELGLQMVAEGVETKADLDELRALGCDYAQGYYICAPKPSTEITEWFREQELVA